MSGSAGSIYKTSSPTSLRGERSRQLDQEVGAGLSGRAAVKMTQGVIVQIDSVNSTVKLRELGGNNFICNGNWIHLAHSPREIAEHWGQLKKGMMVQVFYSGEDGYQAIGFVIRESGEKLATNKHADNSVKTSWGRVCAPGMGL